MRTRPVNLMFIRSVDERTLHLFAAVAFSAIYAWLLFPIARFYWYVPAGLRFAALALLPWRYWPWILGGEFYTRIFVGVLPWHMGASPKAALALLLTPGPAALIFLAPLGALPGSLLLRRRASPSTLHALLGTIRGMGWLLAACLLGALGETLGNLVYMAIDHSPVPPGFGPVRFVLGKLTGDFIGVIALAPALFAVLPPYAERAFVAWRSSFMILSVFAVAYITLMRAPVDAAVYDYAQVLILAPTFIAAVRHGWRGAAIALALCSLLVALVPPLHPIDPYRNLFTQMLLSLFGSASLLLGSAVDAQRAGWQALTTRNTELERANRNLDRLGTELREAAQRNLKVEEEQRRRLAAEIHDELGQNLTAVHTRLKLAADRLDAAHLGDVTTSIVEILGAMRRSVHGLMDSLRPPALDEFGLVHALRDGPLRDMVERARLRYEFTFHGEPALVDALREDTQIAIWRIAQEATTNAVRHARADCFEVRLRIGIRGDSVWAILDLRDDGVGINVPMDPAHRGEGLQGIRDRVLALDGVLRLTTSACGSRLHVLLRQPL